MADVNVDKMRKLGFRMAMVASHPIPLLGFFQNAPLTIQQTVAKISLASVACFMFSYTISVFLKTPLRFHRPSFRVVMLLFVVGVSSGVCLLFTAFYFLILMAAATSLLTCLFIIVPLINIFCVLRYDNYLYVPFFD